MALVIEDGTGKANADSWATTAETETYVTNRGLTVDDTDALEPLLRIAALYVDVHESKFTGTRTDPEQALSWPREDAKVNGNDVGSNVIPPLVKRIQMQLVLEQLNGVDLFPSRQSGQFVTREKIGPIETEYSEAVGTSLEPVMTAVTALLANLYGSNSVGGLRLVRI